MRTKLLRCRNDVKVQLVYPSTLEEYRQVLDVLGGASAAVASGESDSVAAGSRPMNAAYVVTTAQQRHLWGLPDLTVSGRAVPVDEARALDLLHDAAVNPDGAAELFPGRSPEVVSALEARTPGGSWFDAVRGFLSPGARVDQAVRALDRAGMPSAVHEALSDGVAHALGPGAEAAQAELDRVRVLLDLPWTKSEPQRFDTEHVAQVLRRTHAALDGVQARILRFLGSCPEARDLLTFEGPCSCRRAEADALPALVVRPGWAQARASVLCLAGPRGTGKTSLAHAIAEALGRKPVSVSLDGEATKRQILGSYRRTPGCVVDGLRDAKVNNPVFILEGIDQAGDADEDPHPLFDVLDPSNRTAFKDAYLAVPLDLSGVLWIATATDVGAIPARVRDCLHVVDLPAYTEQEKLAIAQEHLLARPFDDPLPTSAGILALEPAASAASAGAVSSLSGPVAPVACPTVVADRVVSSVEELRALSTGPPAGEGGAGEPWRTAASRGDISFEPEAIRRVILDYTSEPGVKDLKGCLAEICRQVALRRSPETEGPDMVTSGLVPALLGVGSVDPLPLAVREAIEAERVRNSSDTSSNASRPSPWIEWLENLPWTKRNDAAIDLKRIRRVLDARQAGLKDAKAGVIEYLAARKRNPRGTGAVLCFLGPPGVGKTSLAQSIAQAMGRRYVRLPCGGLHDDTDLRGHNRTWYRSQPGSILRELRRVGYRDPVVVLDEVDKVGPAPAAVLLEVLDPEQQGRFRDSFVGIPFDLSEILFIATANEWTQIPPPLQDRLEVVHLSGYTEAEKVAIATTHLIPGENKAAGLMPTPVRITDGALRQIIRDYTSEPGIRQLARRIKTVCRKVALGRETGDRALDRERVTARDVRRWFGTDTGDAEGLDRLRRRLDALAIPSEVRSKGRQVSDRLSSSGWASTDSEYIRSREYLECLTDLPWNLRTVAKADLAQVRAQLDEGHAGLAGVKERLLDHVAVHVLNPDRPTPVLCLKGPEGVGKTSLAHSLARALGRACAQVNCGELVDAAALLGDSRGRPGRVITELRRVGAKNPVFVLDELDRLSDRGDLPAAVLELFDSGQRATFRDRYLDLRFDLSDVLFVATAIGARSVPSMLRERLTVVDVPGYTPEEKQVIAVEHLLPAALRLNGLAPEHVEVTDEALRSVIRGYAWDNGLWSLLNELDTLCRKVARRRTEGEMSKAVITPETVAETLGAPTLVEPDVADRMRLPGVALGLGWTPYGGDVLFVEVCRMPGAGELTLTGSLGDVMKESARTAVSWVRANAGRYGLDEAAFRETDLHLHVQAAVEQKDGASGGVALVTALVSSFTGRAVRADFAMTGEITLSGHVLPVVGIKEKVLGASRRGLTHVVLPWENWKHFEQDVADDVRRRITVHYVRRVDDLLDLVLLPAEAAAGRPLESTPSRQAGR